MGKNYLSSTSAPASSKDFNPSASSLTTPSLIGEGAPSTNSLASFKPRPVNSLTSLTTTSLEPPADLRITSNSVFSSAASPPLPAAGPQQQRLQQAQYHILLLKYQLIH